MYAREQSVYIVTISSIVDTDGQSVVPDTVTWSLFTVGGDIINARENVSITPSSTMNITLNGDDLAFQEAERKAVPVIRVLAVNAVYDSSLGNDFSHRDEYLFRLSPLRLTE